MQQHLSPQEQQQYASPSQIPQQMVLCPIQYVYESPMLMQRPPEEQIQQNQPVLFNIQNTPPWIQNRPQNQLVYVHQMPNSYQSYIQQNMIQTPMYQQQLNYQMQPVLTQDNRQFVQIPNLTPYNTVQNQVPQNVPQQINNEEGEKMPLLTQMLSQKNNARVSTSNGTVNVNNVTAANVNNAAGPSIFNVTGPNMNNVRAQNVNNIRAPNVNNIRAPAVNIIRPMMQNQQVQTDISANNRPRPRNGQPQLITINPMQHGQYMTENQQQNVVINISRPTLPYNIADVPHHIRSKIPSSISVKTIYRPILPRQFRPLDVMPSPQNFYYNPNFVSAANNPEMRNSMTANNLQEQNKNVQGEKVSKPTEVNAPVLKKIAINKNQEDNVRKRAVDAAVKAKTKFDLAKTFTECNDKTTIAMNTERNTEFENQPGDKLIRNTVYSQARGRVTEQEILLNLNAKRTLSDSLEEERVAKKAKSGEDPVCGSNKYAKVEVTESTSQTNNTTVNSIAANVPVNTQSTINNLTENAENERSKASNMPELDKIITEPLNSKSPKPEIQKQAVSADLEQRNSNNNNNVSPDKNQGTVMPKVVINRMPNFVNVNSALKVETDSKDPEQKEDITVLTHVLDGYIIQESNVAFPIYIPKKENDKNKQAKTNKTDGENTVEATAETTRLNWRYTDRNIDRETGTIEEQNKDNPFENVQKSAVRSWTTNQLAEHLAKYNWKETASKLQEEEIDGESLMLVNKEQLIIIGVCETHADVIAAFTS